MASLGSVLWFALLVFLLLLIFRLVMEYVFMFARSVRPAGVVAAALELGYTVTDPPLKALRRVIPPLRLGNFALDLSFLIVFISAYILLSLTTSYLV